MQRKASVARKTERIRLFLTDSDGCLTDGGMYYSPDGDMLKKFNAKDGMGILLLHKAGIITGIVTGENTQIVAGRAAKLSMEEVHLGIKISLSASRKSATGWESNCHRRRMSETILTISKLWTA